MSSTIRKGASKQGIVVGLCTVAASLGAACSGSGAGDLRGESVAAAHETRAAVHPAGATAFPNDKTAYDYFRGKGFTSFQAAGIVGNLDQESGIDPTISQSGGGPGRGIAQWSAGGRWDTDQGDNLVAFAQQEGQPPETLGVQLDFIMFELQNFTDYGLAQLQATTNVSDAATAFELGFEGCAIASECDGPQRITYAMDVLSAYGSDPVESDAGTGAPDAGASSEAGKGDDGGTAPPGTSNDAAAPASGDGGAPPVTHADAGAPVTTSDPDAGTGSGSGEVEPAAMPTSGGCAVAAAGGASETRTAWLAALGLVLGVARRRRRRGARRAA